MEIFFGSFLLFCLSRSDARKNINTLESYFFIEDIEVVILIESGTWFFMFINVKLLSLRQYILNVTWN